MKYKIIVKQINIIDIDALTAEEAIKKVKDQMVQQNPRTLFEIRVAEEGKVEENE